MYRNTSYYVLLMLYFQHFRWQTAHSKPYYSLSYLMTVNRVILFEKSRIMHSNVSAFTLFFKRSCQQVLVVSTLVLGRCISIQSIET